ncbi:LamG-like jellyroll fold domain-containing protein [Streptosporangium subroseum]|uniref:LamG-like jellyroll fold domain-containing protein n=1 Tax=Streptosporangium subroseum TaxID=106412 RepID=UPI003442571B
MTVSALTASLLVSGSALPAQATPEPSATIAPSAPVATPFPRPEDPDAALRAGILEARKQNKPVEVVDAFTETSRTWAFPDGSLKTESYTGPTQAKQGDGSWALIDTTLVEKDGVLKPKVGGAADIAFSLGGDDAPFAVMRRDEGQRFSLSWDKTLPRPVVKGNVATYPDAAGPAADLVVTALPTGFRHDVVLRERPQGPLEIRMPVESSELIFAKSKQGGLQLTDGKDKVVAQAPQPVMWDSTGGQDPKAAAVPRRAPISTSVVGAGDKQVLVLKPDTAWLADPATTFPVVVDPTSTLTVKTDTLLSSGADCNVNDQPGATLLKIGAAYYGCNGVDAVNYWRSYLLFDVSSLANKPIISSTMQLWRTQSPDCHLRGNGKIYAGRLNGSWTPRRMTWANKPSTTDFVATPCPTTNVLTPGVMTWPITNWVKDWATGQPNYGIDLEGPTESVDRYSSYSAVFHSAEMTGTGATPPKLITQYILPPEIPTVTAESVDSMDGDHAIVRKSSAKVGYKSTSVDGRNIDYYASVIDSTAPLPAWTTGGGEVGKWNFTDGTGGSDSSGQGNLLTFMDGRYSWIDGKDGKALLLNGTVNAPSSASTDKPVMRTDKSFSAAGWVRLDVGTKTIPLISQSGTVNSAFSVGYDSTSRKWNMQMYHANSGTNLTEIKSSSVAQIGAWTHLVGVYDAVAKKMRLYVNGVLAGEADYTATPWNADQMFELGNGRYSGFGYSSVKAAYDEIRAYNRVLSPTEIQWMLALSPPTNANLPSGQAASITYDVSNVDSFKISIRACINGATPITCSESPYYRITTDAPYLPTDTETGMADPAQPILSGMVNRPSGGSVTAKYYLYDSSGAPVGAVPLGQRVVGGGQRASFQLPADIVHAGHSYSWQMQTCVSGADSAGEVCTSKTQSVGFTTPGTPAEPPRDEVRDLTLNKDNFIIKTVKTDPTACDGAPCPLVDSATMRIGGAGVDKTTTVLRIKLDALPDGAAVSEGIFKLGTSTCPAGACPADAVITAVPLKSAVTGDTKGSDLAGDIDDSATYSFPIAAPQADIAGSEHQWLLLTSNKDEITVFGDPASAEQPSIAMAYLPAGAPSKILNLVAAPGDSGAIATWGLPESNGSVSLLDGYDVEVSAGGDTVRTLEVKDPAAVISGLGNGTVYTIKVRAKTRFGVGDWELTTVTPKAVPPPPPSSPSSSCGFGQSGPDAISARSVDAEPQSAVQEYTDRIKSYYQAQDAVLEGRAATVWDVPGVTPDAPNTAKLSLLNAALAREKQGLDDAGVRRSDSAVVLDDVVVQESGDSAVRVTAAMTRTWTEAPMEESAGADTRAAKATAVPDQVEPSEPSISVFALERCGGVTIIEVALDAGEDSTDFLDPCGGFIPGSSSRVMATAGATASSASDPIVVICSGDRDAFPATSTTPGSYGTFSCHCESGPNQGIDGTKCTMTMSTRPAMAVKGVAVYASGSLGWTVKKPGQFSSEWLDVHTYNAQARVIVGTSIQDEKLLMNREYRAQQKYVLENLRLQPESVAKFRASGSGISFNFPPGAGVGPIADGTVMSSSERQGPKGQHSWRDPGSGENSFVAECVPTLFACGFIDAQLTLTGKLYIDKWSEGVYKSTGWTPWRFTGLTRIVR